MPASVRCRLPWNQWGWVLASAAVAVTLEPVGVGAGVGAVAVALEGPGFRPDKTSPPAARSHSRAPGTG